MINKDINVLPTMTVDSEISAAYIQVSPEPVFRTVTLAQDVMMDLDQKNNLVGIELLSYRNRNFESTPRVYQAATKYGKTLEEEALKEVVTMTLTQMLIASRLLASDPDVFKATRLYEDAVVDLEMVTVHFNTAEARLENAQINLDEAERIYNAKLKNENSIVPKQMKKEN
jgi:uncharacterized protein YuzE